MHGGLGQLAGCRVGGIVNRPILLVFELVSVVAMLHEKRISSYLRFPNFS